MGRGSERVPKSGTGIETRWVDSEEEVGIANKRRLARELIKLLYMQIGSTVLGLYSSLLTKRSVKICLIELPLPMAIGSVLYIAGISLETVSEIKRKHFKEDHTGEGQAQVGGEQRGRDVDIGRGGEDLVD